MKEAANVTINRTVASDVLKTTCPIVGEATMAVIRAGLEMESSRRRVVLATAPALEGSRLPILAEMIRVAAAGRESYVIVVDIDSAEASKVSCPILAKLRSRISKM